MNINPLRPNTGVLDDTLSENIILCCGEDTEELLCAIETATGEVAPLAHEYRCYRFWKYSHFTLIWTGIGTGCLEPLLWETLDNDIVRRVVLIGTAGLLSNDKSSFGKIYVVENAYTAATAIKLDAIDLPLSPRFAGVEQLGLLPATIISTDYYYGFSQNLDKRSERAKSSDRHLLQGVTDLCEDGRLIDMETAQFYHLISIYGSSNVQYVALRGVANLANDVTDQTAYSRTVLTEAARAAVRLLLSTTRKQLTNSTSSV